MSRINNWFIENDINYYVEDITAECGYPDGDGTGGGTGDWRTNIHGYGRE